MEPTPNRLPLLLGGGLLGVVLLAGLAWFAAPFFEGDPEPSPKVAQHDGKAKQQKQQKRKANRPQMGRGPVVYEGEGAEGGHAAKAPQSEEDRAEARTERDAAFNERLDAYADDKGWDEKKTEDVRRIVLGSVQEMRDTMTEARETKSRDGIRTNLQQIRTEQQTQLVNVLGPEESKEFVAEVSVAKFFPRMGGGGGGGGGQGARGAKAPNGGGKKRPQ